MAVIATRGAGIFFWILGTTKSNANVVAANAEDDARLAAESADLLYHLLVLLQARGVPLDAVLQALEARGK